MPRGQRRNCGHQPREERINFLSTRNNHRSTYSKRRSSQKSALQILQRGRMGVLWEAKPAKRAMKDLAKRLKALEEEGRGQINESNSHSAQQLPQQ